MARKKLLSLAQANTPGQRLRFVREAKEMTQVTLARKLNTTQPIISQWETDRWVPSLTTQKLVAETLAVSRTWLYGDIDQQAA